MWPVGVCQMVALPFDVTIHPGRCLRVWERTQSPWPFSVVETPPSMWAWMWSLCRIFRSQPGWRHLRSRARM